MALQQLYSEFVTTSFRREVGEKSALLDYHAASSYRRFGIIHQKESRQSQHRFYIGKNVGGRTPVGYFPLLGPDRFPQSFSLLLLSFLAVTPFHFHVYFRFVSPLPLSSIIYLFLLLLLLPRFLCFRLLHIGSLSALYLALRLLSPVPLYLGLVSK